MAKQNLMLQKEPCLVRVSRANDARGFFLNIHRSSTNETDSGLFVPPAAQVNISSSVKQGTLRGFHGQLSGKGDPKLVYVLRGSIHDVCLVPDSEFSTFRQFEFTLSEGDLSAIFIPRFALHGFQTIAHDTSVLYIHFENYDVAAERRYSPLCPRFSGAWPMKVTSISEKDLDAEPLERKIEYGQL